MPVAPRFIASVFHLSVALGALGLGACTTQTTSAAANRNTSAETAKPTTLAMGAYSMPREAHGTGHEPEFVGQERQL